MRVAAADGDDLHRAVGDGLFAEPTANEDDTVGLADGFTGAVDDVDDLADAGGATDGTGRQYGFGTHRSSEVVAATGDDDSAFDVMLREEAQITEISASLQTLVAQPELARRTAVTLMNLAAQGAQAPPELRAKIGA